MARPMMPPEMPPVRRVPTPATPVTAATNFAVAVRNRVYAGTNFPEAPGFYPAMGIWRVLAPYWLSKEERYGKRWVLFLIICAVVKMGWSVWTTQNLTKIQIYTSPGTLDGNAFWQVLQVFLTSCALYIPLLVAEQYGLSMVSLYWRAWSVKKNLSKYFTGKSYYHVDQGHLKIDNPDQRIDEDIRESAESTVQLAYTFFTAILIMCANLVELFKDEATAVGLIVYVTVGSLMTVCVGQSLVGMNRKMEEKNASLRYGLVRIKENLEAIAFYGGELTEEGNLLKNLDDIVDQQTKLNKRTRWLNLFTSCYSIFGQFVPFILGGYRYFDGQIDHATLLASCSSFGNVVTSASVLVSNFGGIAVLWARLRRLGELMYALDNSRARPTFACACLNLNLNTSGSVACPSCDAPLRVTTEDLPDTVLYQPDTDLPAEGQPKQLILCLRNIQALITCTMVMPRILFSNLNLQMRTGDSLLGMGPSGCGKSTMLRYIAGLWTPSEGVMDFRSKTNGRKTTTLFMSQKPYMVNGTLRAQMLYPAWEDKEDGANESERAPRTPLAEQKKGAKPTQAALESVLRGVKLEFLLNEVDHNGNVGLDATRDWNMLSGGEKQRLSFARAFLAKPDLLLMDEATSALDEPTEEMLYGRLRDPHLMPNTTFISIGHRSTLRAYHTHLLNFVPPPGDVAGPCIPALFTLMVDDGHVHQTRINVPANAATQVFVQFVVTWEDHSQHPLLAYIESKRIELGVGDTEWAGGLLVVKDQQGDQLDLGLALYEEDAFPVTVQFTPTWMYAHPINAPAQVFEQFVVTWEDHSQHTLLAYIESKRIEFGVGDTEWAGGLEVKDQRGVLWDGRSILNEGAFPVTVQFTIAQ